MKQETNGNKEVEQENKRYMKYQKLEQRMYSIGIMKDSRMRRATTMKVKVVFLKGCFYISIKPFVCILY